MTVDFDVTQIGVDEDLVVFEASRDLLRAPIGRELRARYDAIATSTENRSRAAQVLVLFLTTTITSALVVAPQESRLLGVELALAALAAGVLVAVLDRTARGGRRVRIPWSAVVGMLFSSWGRT